MLPEKAEKAIKQYNMILPGETVCTAFSGGADSTALLLIMQKLSEKLDFSLTAVHVNHLLRGEESQRDENFCHELCKRLGIPLTIFRKDAAKFSHSLGVSVETGAREMRYKLFDTLPADKIAAAHNLNDNAETVLFRIARGTGLKGLAGIPPVRGKIIRPLIFCTRSEIEDYLKSQGQNFVTDSTNLLDNFARNRIRHNIIPEMSLVHGAFPENITAMTLSFAEDEDFVSREALKHMGDDLRTVHPAVGKRVIINILNEHKIKISAIRITEIYEAALNIGGKFSVGNGLCAVCGGGKVRITAEKEETPELPKPIKIANQEIISFNSDKIVIITKETDENMNITENIHRNLTSDSADYDKIQGGMLLRNRARSDKIKPVGQKHTRELRKILQEKLPLEQRTVSAVIEDEAGIIWAEHAGVADRVKPDENTRNIISFQISDKRKGDGQSEHR